MQNNLEQIERYRGLREWFDHLVAIVQQYPSAQQDDAKDEEHRGWMAEAVLYQKFACQRCGDFLLGDLFGPCAYAIDDFSGVCSTCYRSLIRNRDGSWTRYARLRNIALGEPELWASVIVAAQERLNLDDWQLEQFLDVSAPQVARLSLLERPATQTKEHLLAIANAVGCEVTKLEQLQDAARNAHRHRTCSRQLGHCL